MICQHGVNTLVYKCGQCKELDKNYQLSHKSATIVEEGSKSSKQHIEKALIYLREIMSYEGDSRDMDYATIMQRLAQCAIDELTRYRDTNTP